VVFTTEYRKLFLPLLGKFVAGVILGLSLSAFLLLPFAEFLMVGHDVHQPSNTVGGQVGLAGDRDIRTTIFYLLPLVFGPVNQSILTNFSGWTGMRSYWGIVATLLALIAVISLVGADKRVEPKGNRLLIAFFSVVLLLMLFKRFAHPLINWIGYLPISEMVFYAKYQEPLVAICVAMLAGLGFSRLLGRHASLGAIAIAAIIILAVMLVTAWAYWPQISQVQRFAIFFYLSMAAGILCVVVAASLMTLHSIASAPRTSQRLVVGIIGLLALELAVNYIVPAFYIYNSPPSASRSPYRGAPFVDFLQTHGVNHSRIFGRQSLLYPNWSAAFELSDVRSLDALYYRRYITFVRNFLLTQDDGRRAGDLADRFTGAEFAYDFDTELEKRFLTLSSVKHLLSATEYDASAFKKIYDRETLIYEVSSTLPRATLFRAVEVVPDDEVLNRLKDRAFNPLETVVLSRESLSDIDPATVRTLVEGKPASFTPASIMTYQSQRVRIEVNVEAPSALMLTDANYPGWRAYVNGERVPVLTANYLFRAVIVPTGKSVVEFVYQPTSVRLGGLISLATLLGLSVLVSWERTKRRRVAASVLNPQ
jgi:hypothetical protein